MDVHIVCCFLLLLIVQAQSICYELKKDKNQYLKYRTGLDFTQSSNFQLHFKTTADNQLVFYAEKKNIDDKDAPDYEGLYINDGFLNYFIFNPTPYGTGASRGGHVRTDFEVNNGTWITVEFFRNKESTVQGRHSGDALVNVNQTGMVVNGKSFVFQGTLQPLDLHNSDLYIGGHEELYRIEDALVTFDGYVDMFKDLKSNTELSPEPPGDQFATPKCDRLPSPFS